MNRALLLICLVGQSAAVSLAQSQPAADPFASLREKIRARFTSQDYPSLQVGVVREDQLVLHETLGLADRDENRSARPDTLYYIGSITKVFTTSLLVQLRDEGLIALDDRVEKFLPATVKLPTDPRGAPAITLRHLATHTSGLPRMSKNVRPSAGDGYGGYTVDAMYEGLAAIELESPIGSRVSYSNLGTALLGHALERAAKRPYHELLRDKILKPLEMKSSHIKRNADAEKELATGYLGQSTHAATEHWNLGAYAPAGALLSNVPEMARFISVQFRAGRGDSAVVSGGSLAELHTPQRVLEGWKRGIGLGWMVEPRSASAGDVVWHNGATAGFASMLVFSPKTRIGVIVLTNCGKSVDALGFEALDEAIRALAPTSASAPAAAGDRDPQLEAVVKKLAGLIVAEPPDEIGTLFSAEFLKQINLHAIKTVVGKVARTNGKFVAIRSIDTLDHAREAEVVLQFENGDVRCIVEIDEADPPKIITLYFPPG